MSGAEMAYRATPHGAGGGTTPTGRGAEMRALVELAGQLRQAMGPVEPPTGFVRGLGRELVEAARRRREAIRRTRRGLLIGAAALGSTLSLIGLVVLLLLRRRGQPPPDAMPG